MESMHTSLVVKKAKMEDLGNQLAQLKREIIRSALLDDGPDFDTKLEEKLKELELEMNDKYQQLKETLG